MLTRCIWKSLLDDCGPCIDYIDYLDGVCTIMVLLFGTPLCLIIDIVASPIYIISWILYKHRGKK